MEGINADRTDEWERCEGNTEESVEICERDRWKEAKSWRMKIRNRCSSWVSTVVYEYTAINNFFMEYQIVTLRLSPCWHFLRSKFLGKPFY
jgi:hypothetical protein